MMKCINKYLLGGVVSIFLVGASGWKQVCWRCLLLRPLAFGPTVLWGQRKTLPCHCWEGPFKTILFSFIRNKQCQVVLIMFHCFSVIIEFCNTIHSSVHSLRLVLIVKTFNLSWGIAFGLRSSDQFHTFYIYIYIYKISMAKKQWLCMKSK